jgi:hypothetical protein
MLVHVGQELVHLDIYPFLYHSKLRDIQCYPYHFKSLQKNACQIFCRSHDLFARLNICINKYIYRGGREGGSERERESTPMYPQQRDGKIILIEE